MFVKVEAFVNLKNF